MIAFLTGKPTRLSLEALIIDVNGVGYKVFVPGKTIAGVTANPELTSLYIHSHVREDSFDLYGFLTPEELNLFEMVIAISGIGPKTGLNILNQGVAELTQAVTRADVDFFTAIPRLGKKNAQKLIIELKPKLGDLEALDLTGEESPAIEALVGLGFSRREAVEALKRVPPDLDLEAKVTAALKYLGTNK